jgi:glutaredoxin-like protein
MALLDDAAREEVSKRFAALTNPVRIVNFTQTIECNYCGETRQIMEELSALSDKINLDVFNFIEDKDRAKAYGVDKIPATVIRGDKDTGIRFYGIPSGYEFMSLLDAITMVSSGDSGLSAASKEQLATLTNPIHLQVFITPT